MGGLCGRRWLSLQRIDDVREETVRLNSYNHVNLRLSIFHSLEEAVNCLGLLAVCWHQKAGRLPDRTGTKTDDTNSKRWIVLEIFC